MPDQGIERFTFAETDRNQIEFGPIFQKKFLKEVCVWLEYIIVQLLTDVSGFEVTAENRKSNIFLHRD